jgi:hypothetical protein
MSHLMALHWTPQHKPELEKKQSEGFGGWWEDKNYLINSFHSYLYHKIHG